MNEPIFSTWSPNDIILPSVDASTSYAAFFVTEDGSIEDLDIEFKQGDWLIYIKKSQKGNWYRSSGGICLFDVYQQKNLPIAGSYTKVRLDNNGNVVDGAYLSEEDIPKHHHHASDFDKDLNERIRDVVGGMLASSINDSVELKYNNITQTLSADVRIDNVTITRNKYGELISLGKGHGPIILKPSSPPKKDENSSSENSYEGDIESTFSPNYSYEGDDPPPSHGKPEWCYPSPPMEDDDGFPPEKHPNSCRIYHDFRLDVDKKTGIGNHRHFVRQIFGWEEEVLEIIKRNAKEMFSVSSIPIDGETIQINKLGQLTCVAMENQELDNLKALVNNYTVLKLEKSSFTGGRILKATKNSRADISSIEEHMFPKYDGNIPYEDEHVDYVEFHSPRVDLTHLKAKSHITLEQGYEIPPHENEGEKGDSSSESSSEENSSESNFNETNITFEGNNENSEDSLYEKVIAGDSHIYANPNQLEEEVTNLLPRTSGTILNNNDMKNFISGEKGRIASFDKKKLSIDEEPVTSIIESHIYQAQSIVYSVLFSSKSNIKKSTRVLKEDNISHKIYASLRDEEYVKENYTSEDDDIVVEGNMLIGEVKKGKISVPRSLMVTKDIILGNSSSHMTHLKSGREFFPSSLQYQNPYSNESLPIQEVYVEMPSSSGVLLTDNSRIDGGIFL